MSETIIVDHVNLLVEVRLDNIKYDVGGTCLQWQFAICDEIHFNREINTPEHWQFSPGCGAGTDPDDHLAGTISEATDAALLSFGELIHRMVRATDIACIRCIVKCQ